MDSRAQAEAQVGTIIGDRYLLRRVLGVGGMGAVFEAEHTVTKKHVALKLIHSELARRNPRVPERFLREAQLPGKIQHPAILEVIDAGRDTSEKLFLIFELLSGMTMERAIAEAHVDAIDCVPVMITVLEVLEIVHARALVHRDIKPENIFLIDGSTAAEHVKLLDFGVAKWLDTEESEHHPLTQSGVIIGTADYMSPEQAAAGAIDGRADIWAVGATLFRCFAGEPPFAGHGSVARQFMACLTQPAPPVRSRCPRITESLAAVIDRALANDPAARFPSAKEMRAALVGCDLSEARRSFSVPLGRLGSLPDAGPSQEATVVAASPVVASRDTEPASIARAPQKSRAPIAVVVGLGMIAGIAATAFVLEREKPIAAVLPAVKAPLPDPKISEPPAELPVEPPVEPPVESPAEAAPRIRKPRRTVAAPVDEKPDAGEKGSPWDRPKRSYP